MNENRFNRESYGDLFAIQVAYTKSPGGIETSVQHYYRMFEANGIPSVCVYAGPAGSVLESEGMDVLPLPPMFASPLHALFRTGRDLRGVVKGQRGATSTLMVIVHSDRCLPAVRRTFPHAVTVTPCHSDKADNKGRADIIVTLNTRQTKLVSEQLSAHRHVVCIGNPYVPMEKQERWKPRADDGVFRLLFASRFIATKDPLTLIRAVSQLPDDLNCEIVFAGSGELESEAKTLAADLGVKAEFLGWQNEPWTHAAHTDCFVLPSHWEGLPFVVLEALARGVPVVASDIAGNRAALGDGKYGLLFEKGSATDLANCIRAAAADKEKHREMAEAGMASVFERFGARAFGDKLVDAVKSIADERQDTRHV